MKRIVTWVMTVLLLLTATMLAVPAHAEEADVIFTIETLQQSEGNVITAGTQFVVKVTTNEIAAISAVEFKFRYDKQLMKPIAGTTEGFMNDLVMKSTTIAPVQPDIGASDVYGEVWITGFTNETVSAAEGDVIATVTFEAVKDITTSTKIFGYKAVASADPVNAAPLTAAYTDGGIEFPSAAIEDITTLPAEQVTNATTKSTETTPTTAPTGDVSMWITFAVIGGVAIVIIILSVVLGKKKNNDEDDDEDDE